MYASHIGSQSMSSHSISLYNSCERARISPSSKKPSWFQSKCANTARASLRSSAAAGAASSPGPGGPPGAPGARCASGAPAASGASAASCGAAVGCAPVPDSPRGSAAGRGSPVLAMAPLAFAAAAGPAGRGVAAAAAGGDAAAGDASAAAAAAGWAHMPSASSRVSAPSRTIACKSSVRRSIRITALNVQQLSHSAAAGVIAGAMITAIRCQISWPAVYSAARTRQTDRRVTQLVLGERLAGPVGRGLPSRS